MRNTASNATLWEIIDASYQVSSLRMGGVASFSIALASHGYPAEGVWGGSRIPCF